MQVQGLRIGPVGFDQPIVAGTGIVVDQVLHFRSGFDRLIAVADQGDFGPLAQIIAGIASKVAIQHRPIPADVPLIPPVIGSDIVVVNAVPNVGTSTYISPANRTVLGAVFGGIDLEIQIIHIAVPACIQQRVAADRKFRRIQFGIKIRKFKTVGYCLTAAHHPFGK